MLTRIYRVCQDRYEVQESSAEQSIEPTRPEKSTTETCRLDWHNNSREDCKDGFRGKCVSKAICQAWINYLEGLRITRMKGLISCSDVIYPFGIIGCKKKYSKVPSDRIYIYLPTPLRYIFGSSSLGSFRE